MQSKKDKLLMKADGYARDKNFKKAVALYKEALQIDPADIRTRLRLSELLYQWGRLPEALVVLQFVGDYYKEHGFLLKAVAVYKKMLEVDPSRTQLHETLAELYFKLGMVPDAVRQFKAHVRALVRQGRVADSLYVVRQMLELDPYNIADRLRLAEQFSRLSLIDDAATEYRRVLKLLERKARTPEWGRVALRYLHHSPDDVLVRKRVIEWLTESGDYHQALQHLYIVLLADNQDTESLRQASKCFEMLNQPDKAIVVLKTLAFVYLQNGLTREEQDTWKHVFHLDPEDPTARQALGMAVAKDQEGGIEVELEWSLPDEMKVAPAVVEEEEVSFSDDWATEDVTLVEPVDAKVLTAVNMKEDSGLKDFRRPRSSSPQGLDLLKAAVESNSPMTPGQLEANGIKLTPGEQEELLFFLQSGFRDEATQVLRDVYRRLSGGR